MFSKKGYRGNGRSDNKRHKSQSTQRAKRGLESTPPAIIAQVNREVASHPFMTAFGRRPFATSERRHFERDIYDFARRIGLNSAQAAAQVNRARVFCGARDDGAKDNISMLDGELSDSMSTQKGPSTTEHEKDSHDTGHHRHPVNRDPPSRLHKPEMEGVWPKEKPIQAIDALFHPATRVKPDEHAQAKSSAHDSCNTEKNDAMKKPSTKTKSGKSKKLRGERTVGSVEETATKKKHKKKAVESVEEETTKKKEQKEGNSVDQVGEETTKRKKKRKRGENLDPVEGERTKKKKRKAEVAVDTVEGGSSKKEKKGRSEKYRNEEEDSRGGEKQKGASYDWKLNKERIEKENARRRDIKELALQRRRKHQLMTDPTNADGVPPIEDIYRNSSLNLFARELPERPSPTLARNADLRLHPASAIKADSANCSDMIDTGMTDDQIPRASKTIGPTTTDIGQIRHQGWHDSSWSPGFDRDGDVSTVVDRKTIGSNARALVSAYHGRTEVAKAEEAALDTVAELGAVYRTRATKRASSFFSPKKDPGERLSRLPFPDATQERFGIIQEELSDDPFKLLVAMILLNQTGGTRVKQVLSQLFSILPDPDALAKADKEQVRAIVGPLGLHNRRSEVLIKFAKKWMEQPPSKNVGFVRVNYPKVGDGKGTLNELPIEEHDLTPGYEVAHLPGVGPYAIDGWRIFCRDELRGLPHGLEALSQDIEPNQEWSTVQTQDKELRAYLRWRWLRVGRFWDPQAGTVNKINKDAFDRIRRGDTPYFLELEERWLGKVRSEARQGEIVTAADSKEAQENQAPQTPRRSDRILSSISGRYVWRDD